MIDNIFAYSSLKVKLIDDPNTNWESLLGQELFGLLKPKFSTNTSVKNEWVFDTSWNLIFHIMEALYFTPPDIDFNTAIENIMEMKE